MLILMDVHMPVVDGFETTREIRLREVARGIERTPIVVVTASVMPEQIANYGRAGVDDVLAKPVTPSSLLATVSRTLARHA